MLDAALSQQVDDDIANRLCAQILLLSAEDPTKDIHLYINSPGGSISAGMAIYDTMVLAPCDVATYAMGMAASMGEFLLAAGTKGKRYALPHARILMHQPLGGITGALELSGTQFEGIGFQAVVGTAGVFVGMLVVYKTGAVRVTPKFTKWLMGAMIGVAILMIVNLVVSFFTTGGLGLRDGSPLAYLFSIVCIGVAAFSLLLDFDMADRAVRDGAPARFSWYIAFGLMTTLVWLYIEILRLLSYLQGRD